MVYQGQAPSMSQKKYYRKKFSIGFCSRSVRHRMLWQRRRLYISYRRRSFAVRRQYEVALSLAGPGTAVYKLLGTPHNPGQLIVVLLALPVGCLQLAVEAGER